MKSKIFKATAINGITSVAHSIVAFLSSVIIARALGPEGRGEIATFFLWLQVATWLSTFGITRGNIYHIGKQRGNVDALKSISKNSVYFALLLGGVVGSIAIFAIPEALPNVKPHVAFVMAILLLQHDILNNLLIAYTAYVYLAIKKLIEGALFLVVVYVAMYSVGPSVSVVMHVYILSFAFGVFFFIYLFRKEYGESVIHPIHLDRMRLFDSLGYGFKAHLADMPKMLFSVAPLLLITPILGVAEFGYYTVGMAIASMPLLIFQSLTPVLFSEYSGNIRVSNIRSAIIRSRWMLVPLGISAMLVALVGWISMPIIIENVFGPSFLDATEPGRVLFLWAIISGSASIVQHLLYATGVLHYVVKLNLVVGLIAILTGFILVQTYGILGVAISMLLGAVLELIGYIVYVSTIGRR